MAKSKIIEKEKIFDREYYDSRMHRSLFPLEESPWLQIYNKTASFLGPELIDKKIIDLGCGTGRLARLLCNKGYKNYTGIDFAPKRIEECKRYVPEYEFKCVDIFDIDVIQTFDNYDVFIILEVLEHIENDLDILDSIPKDKIIIFSVPNYLSESHLRAFKDKKSVINRYGKYIKVLRSYTRTSKKFFHHLNYRNELDQFYTKIFVVKGVKK